MVRYRAALVLTIVALLVTHVSPLQAQETAPAAGPPSVASDALDTEVRRTMEDAGIVGAAAAIILDGEVAWTGAYGVADLQTGAPFTTGTVMNIGSISKTITGVAMMRAAEQGLLSLDDDVDRYLPFPIVNPHRPDQPITLHHLATHTSGITDRPEVYDLTYHYGGDPPVALGEFLRAISFPAAAITPRPISSTRLRAHTGNTPTSALVSSATSWNA